MLVHRSEMGAVFLLLTTYWGELGVDDWRIGKGKPAKDPATDLYSEYKALWRSWVRDNPKLFSELRVNAKAAGNKLSDRFATTPVSQARALAELLNEGINP